MSWLLDTLVWTGVLIAAVLLIRRPVARQFGAKAAYAQLGRKPKCGQCLPFARNIISDVAATA